MSPSVLEHLNALYGPRLASTTVTRLQALLEVARPEVPASLNKARRPLTEGDVMLISYADQVHETGATPLSVLARFLRQRVKGLVSAVHLLPLYPSSSDDGFSVVDYFHVDPLIGTWDDVARLHGNFELMLDGVFNHMSAQSAWFQRFLKDEPEFRNFFTTVPGTPDVSRVIRPRALPLLTEFRSAAGPVNVWTTFSADQVDLNYRNPAVLLKVIEALLFYVCAGARFVRLDAIAFLWKEIGTTCLHHPNTHRVVKLLRAVLDDVAPGVFLITETNVPHAENVSYFGSGSDEAQLVYNFALPPLVLWSFIQGNAVDLSTWARRLEAPSGDVAFLNFLASHDGIGVNAARALLGDRAVDVLARRALEHGGYVSEKHLSDGSRAAYELNINYFDVLSNPAGGEDLGLQVSRFLCAHAMLLALPGMPAIYFHSLFGSRGHRAGAEASGIPRRINREKLSRSLLDDALADVSKLRGRVFEGLSSLLRARSEHPAFAPAASTCVLNHDSRLFALERQAQDGPAALCVHNVSADHVPFPQVQVVPQGRAARWTCSGFEVGPAVRFNAVALEPYEARWFLSDDTNAHGLTRCMSSANTHCN